MASRFPDHDERSILVRLGIDPDTGRKRALWSISVIGLCAPNRWEAAERLRQRGLVVTAWGEGKDAGLLMVRLAATGRPPPYPTRPFGGLVA